MEEETTLGEGRISRGLLMACMTLGFVLLLVVFYSFFTYAYSENGAVGKITSTELCALNIMEPVLCKHLPSDGEHRRVQIHIRTILQADNVSLLTARVTLGPLFKDLDANNSIIVNSREGSFEVELHGISNDSLIDQRASVSALYQLPSGGTLVCDSAQIICS